MERKEEQRIVTSDGRVLGTRISDDLELAARLRGSGPGERPASLLYGMTRMFVRVTRVTKLPGIRRLVSFLDYIAFDGPGVVRLSGVGLMLLLGLTHMYSFPENFQAATYIGLCFGALFAGTLVAAFGILVGRWWGWELGAWLSIVPMVAYVISRTWGLPGIREFSGAWATPAGTFSVAWELSFLALYATVLLGINVTYPDRQGWHD